MIMNEIDEKSMNNLDEKCLECRTPLWHRLLYSFVIVLGVVALTSLAIMTEGAWNGWVLHGCSFLIFSAYTVLISTLLR